LAASDKKTKFPFIDRRRYLFLRKIYAFIHVGLIDLDFKTLVRRIMQLETIAFAGIIAVSWVNEIYQLPSLIYGTARTAPNLYEASLETAWALFVLFLVLVITKALLKQIRYLGGFLPVCSYCKSIRVNDHWVALEDYLHEHADVKMTHSLCPACAKKYYDYDEEEELAAEVTG